MKGTCPVILLCTDLHSCWKHINMQHSCSRRRVALWCFFFHRRHFDMSQEGKRGCRWWNERMAELCWAASVSGSCCCANCHAVTSDWGSGTGSGHRQCYLFHLSCFYHGKSTCLTWNRTVTLKAATEGCSTKRGEEVETSWRTDVL